MEIQGLSDAQNIHCQHGALHRLASSPLRSATGSIHGFISTDSDADRLSESQGDNINKHRPRTSAFHLLVENGSGAVCSAAEPRSTDERRLLRSVNKPIGGLHNINTQTENVPQSLHDSPECVWSAWQSESESEEGVLKMAQPSFQREEEPLPQRQLTLPFAALRQQREDGAFKHSCLHRGSSPRSCPTVHGGTIPHGHVGFDVVREDVNNEANKHRADLFICDKMKGKTSECSTSPSGVFMEAGNSSDVILCESNDTFNYLDTQVMKKAEHVFNGLNDTSVLANAKQAIYQHIVEDAVLTNKNGDKVCGQICAENSESNNKLVKEVSSHSSSALISGSPVIFETMDTTDFISDSTGLQEAVNPGTASSSPPASETFSGTITINNQSITVTIENGVLTLAAQPEGYVHKEDDMISLKEHLGMKDHEDIVLLNYDSGTKSIGKISTLAVPSSFQQDEPRPGLSVSDSELALVDDCSLSELGTSLDSCPIIKQEAGDLCAVTEADLVAPNPKVAEHDNGDLQSVQLTRSKKETVTSFHCPGPGCNSTFDTRQKLKVHLLNHAEDPRPYQCTVKGCGWAFGTTYKLRRHLQSHDKQRPHTCHFEGCGRRFTTVYNLKAHIKAHQQDNAFVCEICSERFRSASRLTNHQRVHFEPQRPHKCEFPGNAICLHILRFICAYLPPLTNPATFSTVVVQVAHQTEAALNRQRASKCMLWIVSFRKETMH